ncbi:MAG: phage portal protein [Brevundimonas sp.]|uniref:phage portal protein n=1 Tax=Brevundimonas sp. TaxID=1871086 RepID=UPI00391B58F1
MGFFDRLMGVSAEPAPAPITTPAPRALGETATFLDLHDAAVGEFLRGGHVSNAGVEVTTCEALKNATVFRCVDLICSSIAMLPLNVHRELENGDTEKAKDDPVYRLLRRRPNDLQTPFEFKFLMQYRALTEDNGAVALIVRSGGKPIALWPLDPSEIEIDLTDTYQPVYTRTTQKGRVRLDPRDVLHLRGMTFDGVHGVSRVKRAAEAIGIAIAAERAVANMFRKGVFATGAVSIPGELTEEAFNRLKAQWAERYEGSGNAGSTPILEGGSTYVPLAINARDAQSAEARKFQVEEILRVFGVPRSLAMVDDTSWGSGIEQLSTGFVRYALNSWFTAWEEAIGRSLLAHDADLVAKFNPDALLNGTTKEQSEVFAKASGAGGHKPWMTANEIRKLMNMPAHPDGDGLVAAGTPAPNPGNDNTDAAPTDLNT